VTRWAELGRAEEALSRQLAQTALNQVAKSAVDEVAESPRVHVLIKGFVQEQSLGLTDVAIEEIRERTVTGDIRLERFLRPGRQPRESLPAPTSTVDKPAQPETKGRR
jgi:RNase P/RNase MRP subunit p30